MLIRKKMRELSGGDILKVIADDPSTQRDIPKFCQFMDHKLLEHYKDNTVFVYIIQKSG